ncbi:hypothetical protein STEG23_021807, partial [Scotinomys teguina]
MTSDSLKSPTEMPCCRKDEQQDSETFKMLHHRKGKVVSCSGWLFQLSLEVPLPLMFPMTVTPLGRDQDCNLKNRELDVRLSWFLDPGGWGKTTAIGLYFIFPGICNLSLSGSQNKCEKVAQFLSESFYGLLNIIHVVLALNIISPEALGLKEEMK